MSDQTIREQTVRSGVVIEIVSVAWMILEAAGTVTAGVIARSTALEVFGIDSIIEIVGGVTLLWRLTVEARGGSMKRVRRAEHSAEWIIGVALLALALYIVAAAILALVNHETASPSVLGIVVTLISSAFMPFLAVRKKKIGKAIGSKALVADGFCSMVCAYMSWIVLVGVVATAVSGWWWVDAVTSLGLVYFVAKEGLEAVESARENGAASRRDA